MKTQTIKTLFVAIFLVAGISFAKADERNIDNKSLQYNVETYIKKIKTGYSEDFSNILSNDVKFNLERNGKMMTHGKNEELAFMKSNVGIIQNCKLASSALVSTTNYSLVKISMIYPTFVREDYVTMVRTNQSWKITEVTSIFK
ncbi:MAG: nuclear transport factor 2 family protein [Pelobium sp.]